MLFRSVICKNSATGTINLTPTGGTPSYYYLWSNGSTNEDVFNLLAGNYSVKITDANGCTVVKNYNVSEPLAKLTLTIHKTNIRCGGKNTGASDAIVSGGVMPYSYLWSNGYTTSSVTGLFAGTYTCTVTDNNGCSTSKTFTLTQNPILTLFTTVTNVSSYGGSNGSATAVVSGGLAPFSYFWKTTPTQTTVTATGLPAALYKVRVTDSKGCFQTANASVSQPNPKVVNDLFTISVFPTPAREKLIIAFTSSKYLDIRVDLMSLEGQIIRHFSNLAVYGQIEKTIDLNGIASGVYSLRVVSDGILETRKVVIQ